MWDKQDKKPGFCDEFRKINELIAQDMAGVNAAITEQLNSDVQLINQLGYYIVSGGGKRIRPMIAILAARAVGYQEMPTSRSRR